MCNLQVVVESHSLLAREHGKLVVVVTEAEVVDCMFARDEQQAHLELARLGPEQPRLIQF